MDQHHVTQIIEAIRALDSKTDLFKNEVNRRFDHVEQRLSKIENAIVHLAGPHALPRFPAVPSFSATPSSYQSFPLPPTAGYGPTSGSHGYTQKPPQKSSAPDFFKIGGSLENVSFLPFAIEAIARASQQKRPGDDEHRCSACGAPTFSLECFRGDHFRWCRVHQRPMLRPHNNCGRGYGGCEQVRWENHADWEMIVQQSYKGGYLGTKRVDGLNEMLFPKDIYSQKYNVQGWFTG